MNNKADKLICEGVENYIRSQIPIISKNIQEAVGEGLLTRGKMLLKQKYLERKIKSGLRGRPAAKEANLIMKNRLHRDIAPHLISAGIDPEAFRRVQTYPTATHIATQIARGTVTQQMLNQHAERMTITAAVDHAAVFNPTLEKLLSRFKKVDTRTRVGDLRALNAANPNISGSLQSQVDQLRQKREQLRQERIAKIPLEYSSYSNLLFSKPLFKTPPGSSVPVPTGSQRNLLVRSTGSPIYAPVRRRRGGGAGGQRLINPNLQLRPLGRILSKLETIV